MESTRRQLTLFISDQTDVIEKIRAKYNPCQYSLIAAHITLCREEEIENWEKILKNIKSISLSQPLQIKFGPVERFSEKKGLMISAKAKNQAFRELRKTVLGFENDIKNPQAHITLMHPRNSTCTDEIFELIKRIELPTELYFDKIHVIEQRNGDPWLVVESFSFLRNK